MHWNLIAHQFRTVVQFKNQEELAGFVLQIAKIADQMDHHPDLTIRHCSELSISVYSHDQNKITKRDHALIEAITHLYEEASQISVRN